MRIVDLINKKKNNQPLTEQEIKFIINGYVNDEVADYQMSALTMAIYFNGMSSLEITYLTKAMVNSGISYDLEQIEGFKVDKHSSGGVGDKTSLIYAPLVASFGVKVAKMSGRGLGQTGGTIDKLESFKGFKTEITFKQFIDIVNQTGISIMAQSEEIVPADKKLYLLRDVTATVDSPALIAASIMCKKIATGSDGIILDVKYGNGAFMKTVEQAENLANIMVDIGKHLNKKIAAMITNMEQPLGRAIGNAIEIYETFQTLRGQGPDDLIEIVTTACAVSLVQANVFTDFNEAKQASYKRLQSGDALPIFKKWIQTQGGQLDLIENVNALDDMIRVKNVVEINAKASGYVNIIDNNRLGLLAMQLGAGRANKTENIDHMAGIYLNKKSQEYVNQGEVVMTLYTNRYVTDPTIESAYQTFTIENKKTADCEMIHKIVQ